MNLTLIVEVKPCADGQLLFPQYALLHQAVQSAHRRVFIIILVHAIFKPVNQFSWMVAMLYHVIQCKFIEEGRRRLDVANLMDQRKRRYFQGEKSQTLTTTTTTTIIWCAFLRV